MEELIKCFNTEIEMASKAETIEEAISHLTKARNFIGEIEKIIPKMKQVEHDLLQDVYNKLKPGEKPYVKTIKYDR